MAASREPGSRSKIAVASTDSDIDPVGACVGMKGSRVQNVVQELKGEKIDIIPWHVDAAKFVCNALAPAVITRVVIDEDNKSMEVIVPDDSLSIAIGKRGQNVRLASRLTGWRLDVKSENKYKEALKKGHEDLSSLPGVSPAIADLLCEIGFNSVEELAKASIHDIDHVIGIGEENAGNLIEAAKKYTKVVKNDADRIIETKGDADNGLSDAETIKDFVENEPENDTDDKINETETVSDEKYSDMDKGPEPNAGKEEPEKIEDNEI
jgi:N utilization substance protein A